jgi:hypothetical protein
MAMYNVNVQDKFYKTFEFASEGYNLLAILTQVNADQASGDLVIDQSQPLGVVVTPADSNA